jgi:hypothetical protein
MFTGRDGENINGPSLILAPDWLPNRLGKFYLYFAHHSGTHIRLAYADDLTGPWTLYPAGTLQLSDAHACQDHIASPDVHLDTSNDEIILYFHGVVRGGTTQKTFMARSRDGITFTAGDTPIADFYLRVAPWRDSWIGMSKGGVMYLADQYFGPYERLPKPAFPMRHKDGNAPGDVRHAALKVTGDTLEVYYSRIGGRPERILRATIDLTQPKENWRAANPQTVLKPELPWEGAQLRRAKSRAGASTQPENALRDPAIFLWEGRTYLLYTGAGEANIGIAQILDEPPSPPVLRFWQKFLKLWPM